MRVPLVVHDRLLGCIVDRPATIQRRDFPGVLYGDDLVRKAWPQHALIAP